MLTRHHVPYYAQRDNRWKNDKLGTSSVTVGDFGCAITAIAMMDSAFDPKDPWNPRQVNNYFTQKGGYANKNLVIWSMIERLLPNSDYLGADWTPNSDAPVGKIRTHLDSGGLALLQVGFGGDAAKMHFVLAVGYEGDDIIFMDPWYGPHHRFSNRRYGLNSAKAINVTHYFSDGIPNAPAPRPIAPPPPVAVAPKVAPAPVVVPAPTPVVVAPVAPAPAPVAPAPVPAMPMHSGAVHTFPVPPVITPAPAPSPRLPMEMLQKPWSVTAVKPCYIYDIQTGEEVALVAAGTPLTLTHSVCKDEQVYLQTAGQVKAAGGGVYRGFDPDEVDPDRTRSDYELPNEQVAALAQFPFAQQLLLRFLHLIHGDFKAAFKRSL